MSSTTGQKFSLIRREIRGSGNAGGRPESTAPGTGLLVIGQKKRPAREGYYGAPKCPVGTMFASRFVVIGCPNYNWAHSSLEKNAQKQEYTSL
jgi:hypothetical protein